MEVTSSAILNLLCWNEPIDWPKALRSLAYSMVSSRICLAWATFAQAAPTRSCGDHNPRSRPISIFMISLEPAQILVTRASRQARATRYSFMNP